PPSPSSSKTVRVTHGGVAGVAGVRGDLADAGGDETREAFVDLATPEAHRDAVVEIEFPGTARVEPDRGETHACFDELALRREIAVRDFALAALRAREPRKLRRN